MTTATRKASKPKARPLGRWSPGTATRGQRQRDILAAARKIQLAIQRMFVQQRAWMKINWMLLASPAQQRALAKADDPLRWEDWVDNVVIELVGPLGVSMEAGAAPAIDTVAVAVDWTIDNPGAQRYIRRHGLELARGINRTTQARIRARIATGISTGQSTEQIAQGVQSAMRTMTARRARVIAQTEVIRAMSEGAKQVYQEAGVEKMEWLDKRPNHDALCARLHGQQVPVDGVFTDPDTGATFSGPPAHPGCVVGSTVVSGLSPQGALRVYYDGPMLDIQTRNGHKLSITPNHPVLTTKGFVPAGGLRPGDNVFSRIECDRVSDCAGGDEQLMPARIAQVYESLQESLGVASIGVPASPEDLHGDAKFGQGDIDVVYADSFLRLDLDAAIDEMVRQDALQFGNPGHPALSPLSDALPLISQDHPPFRGLVGVGGQPLAVDGVSVAIAEPIRFGLGPADAGTIEDARDYTARDTREFRQLLLRFPFNVSTDQVISIRQYDFSGHVYDLQMENHMYSAGGIIVHNCQCAIRAVVI